jgi:7-carboxy-7-deazaguanine synthase
MRVSEVYRSIQGEGPKVGLPTTFLRFAGCNLRCPSWPCDTPHAIFPEEYRKEWTTVSPEELANEVITISAPGENICFTGGEPFLQHNAQLKWLTDHLQIADRGLECFSNGTLVIPEWAFEKIDFVIDWKLPGSGEINFNAEIFLANLHRALGSWQGAKRHSLKFTVASFDDFVKAVERLDANKKLEELQVFVGPVWGKVEPREVARWILEWYDLDWRLNLQTHKYIWNPDARRT